VHVTRLRAESPLAADKGAIFNQILGDYPFILVGCFGEFGLILGDLPLILGSYSLKTGEGGTSDPFVELYVKQPGRPQKERTPVIKATINPTWQHGNTFKLAVRTASAPVCFTVWDHDAFSGNDFLGEALLQLGTISAAIKLFSAKFSR